MKDKLQMLAYNIGAVLIGLVISGCMLLFMKVDPLAVCAEALGKIFSTGIRLVRYWSRPRR